MRVYLVTQLAWGDSDPPCWMPDSYARVFFEAAAVLSFLRGLTGTDCLSGTTLENVGSFGRIAVYFDPAKGWTTVPKSPREQLLKKVILIERKEVI